MRRQATQFFEVFVAIVYVISPGLAWAASDSLPAPSVTSVVLLLVVAFVLGALVPHYRVALLALNVAAWFAVAVVGGQDWAVRDWHDHTGSEVVAILILVAFFAGVIALGVWSRRKVSERGRPRVRPSSRRETLRQFGYGACAGLPVAFLMSLLNSRLAWLALAAAVVGGWSLLAWRRRRAQLDASGSLEGGHERNHL
jgi:hypothetical protein